MTMKVGAVHNTTMAVAPIQAAFLEEAPDVELMHIMDTPLIDFFMKEGRATAAVARRLIRLIEIAEEAGAGCVLLTASIFNPIVDQLQPLFNAKIFRPAEAMLDAALAYDNICLATTVAQSAEALAVYLRDKKPSMRMQVAVAEGAFDHVRKGEQEAHDEIVLEMLKNINDVDAIVLTQYSLSHFVGNVPTSIPLLCGPQWAAKRCVKYLKGKS